MRRHTKAFTLIELIMVIVVVGVLATGLALGIRQAIDLWVFLSFRDEVVSQARLAIMRMAREIRLMPLRSQAEPILNATDSSLRFTVMDLDADTNDDTLEFDHDAGNNELRREFNGIRDVLAEHITSLTFAYFDDNRNPIATPVADTSGIYHIRITLIVSDGRGTQTLSTQVFPRNLAY